MTEERIEGIINTLKSYSQVCETAIAEIKEQGHLPYSTSKDVERFLFDYIMPDKKPCYDDLLTSSQLKYFIENLPDTCSPRTARRFKIIPTEAMRAIAEYYEHDNSLGDKHSALAMWNVYNFVIGMRRWANLPDDARNEKPVIKWTHGPETEDIKDESENKTRMLITEFPQDEFVHELEECIDTLEERVRKMIAGGICDILYTCRCEELNFEDATVLRDEYGYDTEIIFKIHDHNEDCYYPGVMAGIKIGKYERISVRLINKQRGQDVWKEPKYLSRGELSDILRFLLKMNEGVEEGTLLMKDTSWCTIVVPAEKKN